MSELIGQRVMFMDSMFRQRYGSIKESVIAVERYKEETWSPQGILAKVLKCMPTTHYLVMADGEVNKVELVPVSAIKYIGLDLNQQIKDI